MKIVDTCPAPSSGEAAPAANETESVRDRDHPRCNNVRHAIANAQCDVWEGDRCSDIASTFTAWE